MFDKFNRLHLTAAALVLGLGAAGFATADGQPSASSASSDEPLRCEIVASAAHGMTALEGVLHTDAAISGSYSFRVVSSGGGGSSNISQGGEFFAGPNEPAKLGTVMLGNSGGSYKATLEVIANGKTIACAERTNI